MSRNSILVDPRTIVNFWDYYEENIWPTVLELGYMLVQMDGVKISSITEFEAKQQFSTTKGSAILQNLSEIPGLNGAYTYHSVKIAAEEAIKQQKKNERFNRSKPWSELELLLKGIKPRIYLANMPITGVEKMINSELGVFHPKHFYDARHMSTWLTGERPLGILEPSAYFGKAFTSFGSHVEDHLLAGGNWALFGRKQWFFSPASQFDNIASLHNEAHKASVDYAKGCTETYRHKYFYFSNKFLSERGIDSGSVVQEANQIMFVAPRVFHQGFNLANNVNIAMNIAPRQYLETGLTSKQCSCTRESAGYILDLRGPFLTQDTKLFDTFCIKQADKENNTRTDEQKRTDFITSLINNKANTGLGNNIPLTADQIKLLPIIYSNYKLLESALFSEPGDDEKALLRQLYAQIRNGVDRIDEIKKLTESMKIYDITVVFTGLTPRQLATLINSIVAQVVDSSSSEVEQIMYDHIGFNYLAKEKLREIQREILQWKKYSPSSALDMDIFEAVLANCSSESWIKGKDILEKGYKKRANQGSKSVSMSQRLKYYTGHEDRDYWRAILKPFIGPSTCTQQVAKSFFKVLNVQKPSASQLATFNTMMNE